MYLPSATVWIFIIEIISQIKADYPFYRGSKPVYRGKPGKVGGYERSKTHPCEKSSCYPATGNLLIGRENQLYASSTCGLHRKEKYCIVSYLDDRKKCFHCDSRPTSRPSPLLNHNVTNIVYPLYPGTNQKSWWQSENGKENVFIQLDLEAEFHFTHLVITFKTFRPAAMLIERSYDFKQTWQVYRYFAANCTESFPGIKEGTSPNLTDVICENRYSAVAPSTGGEIIFRVIPPSHTHYIDNPYSKEVQNLLKMTNLRINFTKLHTLGDDLLDRREEIQEKYYYAISDMVVRGSCSCYGHASYCLPSPDQARPGVSTIADMVHGRCECTHNTKGRNCEQCEDFFNDVPWRPAIGLQTNSCKRCNCNNHATSCHFDAALYEATGHVSGGVCDGCQHNTMGANCDQCKPFFYKDPSRDIQDPEVCRPCDCDPHGSLENGICDSITIFEHNLMAGSCHCKTNVEGRRCDNCKNGYWNFTSSNPDGCQSCTCDTFGTVDNQGCNVDTGTCTCKRYVTGKDCNQCLPEFWGLSEKENGCNACECDSGGAFDNNCDIISGQCRCRPHMTGRACDTPAQQYFTASIDFTVIEAETSRTNGQVVIREPLRDGDEDSWTGSGFVKASEGNFIEFLVDDIRTSTDYEIVIRYETLMPEVWQVVDVNVIRLEPVDPRGPCAYYNPEDDFKHVTLPPTSNSIKILPASCLEAGKTYKIIIEFRKMSPDRESPQATVLIDSILLIPRIEKLPIFTGSTSGELKRHEYERHNCEQLLYTVQHQSQIPEVCKKYHASIAAYIYNGAMACQCDPTGSISKLCDVSGGHCQCKPNVVGRKCDSCAPGTYGFGPEGCKPCECNSIGALDNFCNVTTGQCKCRANTYGRECDQCRTGFWNFPNCQRCDCNGHADICDSKTGACINCRDNTEGHTCEKCVNTFYGDPRIGVDIMCRPCPCPGAPGSNHSFAESCSLDPVSKDVMCDCQEGYSGLHCDVCSDNYFGNPEVPGGSCQSCDCNGKIDLLVPGNCDPHTGKCKQCLNDTTGDHCEVCRPGFFRFGEDRPCEECTCHILGTNATAGPCDPESGQCTCLPNVQGLRCDECIPLYWKIASGEGCEGCDCDPQGSLDPQCNEFDGQCRCKPGFGGRKCNECVERFWGNPKVECKECKCDPYGSKTYQCDRVTGACICNEGIGGYNCDTCAKGYLGNAPRCKPCGECFDNWDRILQETRNNTERAIDKAGEIKKVGATGAYTTEFDNMQHQLEEIDQLLNNTDQVNPEVIDAELETLRKKINETEKGTLSELENSLQDIKQNLYLTDSKITEQNNSINSLKERTKKLEEDGTQLQETNVQGALELIKSSKQKADFAVHRVEHAQEAVQQTERQCKATDHYLNQTKKNYEQKTEINENILQEVRDKIDALNQQIPELSTLLCDGDGDCDSICGGIGCGSCGGSISCERGAKQQAEAAVSLANATEATLRNKESEANDFIRNFTQINTEQSKMMAQETFDLVNGTLIKCNNTLNNATSLMDEIRDFMGSNNTKPEDINKIGEEILNKEMSVTPEGVKELANTIKEAVDRLTNTEAIIYATKDDLATVNRLKAEADAARENAGTLKTDAEGVNTSLEETANAQAEALEAIENAWNDYKAVEKRLNTIGNETETAQETTSEINSLLTNMSNKLKELQGNILNNGIYATKVINESSNIVKNADKIQTDFEELKNKYESAKNTLDEKLNQVKSSKERTVELMQKAFELHAKVTKTQDDIEKLEKSSRADDINLLENQLEGLIQRMNYYTEVLENKVKWFKGCTPTK